MPPTLAWSIAIPAAFLIGSIPFGVLIARSRGVDLRKVGSGNIGATNLGRVLGFRFFMLCFVLDMAKGLLPTLGAALAAGVYTGVDLTQPRGLNPVWTIEPAQSLPWLGTAAAAILGHVFSPFVGFRGGKGVATGLGAMLGVFPILSAPALAAFGVWSITLALWRYVSLASCAAAATMPLWTWYLFSLVRRFVAQPRDPSIPEGLPAPRVPIDVEPWPFYLATGLIAALVIYRHRANLGRLTRGEEPRIGEGRPASASAPAE